MSDRTTKKTKAELLEMLAEAVRNTQPQPPIGAAHPEPVRDVQRKPERKTGPVSKRKTKAARASGRRKQR
jgi:hypothetical protein